MGKIIAVGNLKGGTGKSTIAVNLACRLAEQEHSVALIDADPQGTAAAWLRAGPPPGLGLVPLPLAPAEADAWADEISARRQRHERTVIDLPPQPAACFETALGLADLLVVPLTMSEVDLHATAQALALLHRMRRMRAGRPACLLVPSKVDRRTALGRQARDSLSRLGWEVAPALGQRAAHAEAFKAATWIGGHAPGSAAHREVCRLVEQVEAQLGRCPEIAEEYRPSVAIEVPAPAVAAPAGAGHANGAPVRIGALLSLMGSVLAKLRRSEQEACY
jgi:chromosome partitioning protein